MLKAINTKILLAIIAALTAIGGVLTYQRHEAAKRTVLLPPYPQVRSLHTGPDALGGIHI